MKNVAKTCPRFKPNIVNLAEATALHWSPVPASVSASLPNRTSGMDINKLDLAKVLYLTLLLLDIFRRGSISVPQCSQSLKLTNNLS